MFATTGWLALMGWLGNGGNVPSCAEQGCAAVQSSPLGRLLGVPLAWWGVLACLTVLTFGIWRVWKKKPLFGSALLLGGSFVIVASALGATAYSALAVRAYCTDCLVACGGILLSSFVYGYGSLALSDRLWRPGGWLVSMGVVSVLGVSWVGFSRSSIRESWIARANMLFSRELSQAGAISIGKSDAKAIWVAFVDYECGPCHDFMRNARKKIEAGELRLYLLNNPLRSHPNALRLAEAVQTAWKEGTLKAYMDKQLELALPAAPGNRRQGTDQTPREIVERQRHMATELGIQTTPAVFDWTGGKVGIPDWKLLENPDRP